ncbi:MAG: hypothetical protein Q8O52_29780 [Sulfuritalea sp.]|nr:hypothetical protein [Sulfuritalea sp.]
MKATLIALAREIRDDGSIVEMTYDFTTLDILLTDFERDVKNWRE